jgi:AcrR family transcriptional regulator
MSDIASSAGISRQALYLHFANRTELLIATTHYVDRKKDIDQRLALSRGASSGLERLEAFVDAWGNYIPEIYGVANALIVMGVADESARQAWTGRLAAVREGCEAIILTLCREDQLSDTVNPTEATDILCAHLSVETWRYLRHTRGWNQTRYLEVMQQTLRNTLVR